MLVGGLNSKECAGIYLNQSFHRTQTAPLKLGVRYPFFGVGTLCVYTYCWVLLLTEHNNIIVQQLLDAGAGADVNARGREQTSTRRPAKMCPTAARGWSRR